MVDTPLARVRREVAFDRVRDGAAHALRWDAGAWGRALGRCDARQEQERTQDERGPQLVVLLGHDVQGTSASSLTPKLSECPMLSM